MALFMEKKFDEESTWVPKCGQIILDDEEMDNEGIGKVVPDACWSNAAICY